MVRKAESHRHDGMKLVKQINTTTCGQACVAMVLNITIQEAIKLIGHSGITSDEDICKALALNTKDSISTSKNINHNNSFPKKLCKHRNPKNFKEEHWTIFDGPYILDPACIAENHRWSVYKYWELK